MSRFRLAIVALILAAPAHAGFRPSFSIEHSGWFATHIVVVDAKGTVLESWRGDLKKGDMLPLNQLGVPTPDAIKVPGRPRPKEIPERVSGERTILFLIRDGDRWKPSASFGGMQVSVAWIERDQVYAYVQWINPGDTELIPLGESEASLKRRSAEIEELHERLRAAGRHADPTKRAEETLRFVDVDFHFCRFEALEMLAGCGKNALPALRKVIQDEKRLHLHGDILATMGKVGGVDVRDDMLKVVAEELRYWKKVGPTLDNWWGKEPMTIHYGRLITALRQLRATGITMEQRKLIEEMRDYWSSVPSLDAIGKGGTGPAGQIGRSQIPEEADGILKPKR